jgi:hypothetical protein
MMAKVTNENALAHVATASDGKAKENVSRRLSESAK